jgi:hypothetical protein
VVPVLIEGTFEALRRGTILLKPVSLKLTFHSPIPAGSFKDRDRWIYAQKVQEVLLASSSQRPASLRGSTQWG